MDHRPAPDVPLLVTVPSTTSAAAPPLLSAERRINPSWTVAQLKAKLEPITGIPPGWQELRIRGIEGEWVAVEGEERRVGEWGLRRDGEMEVCILSLVSYVFLSGLGRDGIWIQGGIYCFF
jgi:tubulin-specific chaperone B